MRQPSLRFLLLRWLLPAMLVLLLAGAVTAYWVALRSATKAYDRALFDIALAIADQLEASHLDKLLPEDLKGQLWRGVPVGHWIAVLILMLSLPPLLAPADDVHRLTAGMFTISYSCAVIVPILSGVLWDVTGLPIVAFLPPAACAVLLMALAPSVRPPAQDAV